MDISYENKINLAFDKPLEYRGILLYPATLPYFSVFASADECLDAPRLDEKDVKLLRLPYLEYMYEKSLIDEGFKNRWNMLIGILNIVFGEDQPFDILKDEGRLYIKVYQRSENYELLNKEYTILKANFLAKYNKDEGIEPSKEDLEFIAKEMSNIQEKMYDTIQIGSEDFDNIRQLIMLQNDIKSQHYDARTERLLYEMKSKLRGMNNADDGTDLEDLITAVCYAIQKDPIEIESMTIRRFNRYLNILTNKDDYYMYKQLELSGMIKMKSDLPHWLKHYTPKGKFDDILVDGNGLLSSIGDNGKI